MDSDFRDGFKLEDREIRPLEGSVAGRAGLRHLHPKAMEVLVCLAEHAGRVILRNEILDRVWGHNHGTDKALTRCIREVRAAPDDRRGESRFIETIPKRGYRLVVSVEPLIDAAEIDICLLPAILRRNSQKSSGGTMRTIAALSLLLATATAAGHHSRSHFSDEISVVEGTLVAVHWVNPHVGFTVEIANEAGEAERWRIEGVTNLGGMRRDGVEAERFTIGGRVRFAGNLSMRRPRDFLATNVLLEDGVEVVLDGAAGPFWEGEFIGRPDPSLTDTTPVDAAADNRGIFRVWSMAPSGVGQRTSFPFTDAAIAARANWDLLDNFAENCEREGMPRIMRNPHPFEFVDDGNEITIVSELYDLIRTVHMDQGSSPADVPASPLGYSVGHWDDDSTLLVTTTHVNWPYFDNIGTPQSENVQMHETFTVSDDQTRLDYRLTVTDPGTFSQPAVYERYWLALGAEIELYDCQVF